MVESRDVTIAKFKTETVLGLAITVTGTSTMGYSDRPPGGVILLDLERDGGQAELTLDELEWGKDHAVLGYTLRVLNAPEERPRLVQLRVTAPER